MTLRLLVTATLAMEIGSRMSRILIAAFMFLAVAAPRPSTADGHDTLGKGPAVGEKIPHSLAVPNQNNQYRDFKSLARRRGLILMFSRSLDW